jgi:hypothetical protein
MVRGLGGDLAGRAGKYAKDGTRLLPDGHFSAPKILIGRFGELLRSRQVQP